MLDLKTIFDPDRGQPTAVVSISKIPDASVVIEQPRPPIAHNAKATASPAAVTDGWPNDLAALADWVLLLAPDDLPATPFEFGGPYCVVVDECKFIASLKTDIRRGTSGPRARYGALQSDLHRLRDLLLNDGIQESR